MASGVGPQGQNRLDQATNGRQIQMGFDIDDDAFEMTASNPADLRDQLRLMATKLAAPRWIPRRSSGCGRPADGFDLNDASTQCGTRPQSARLAGGRRHALGAPVARRDRRADPRRLCAFWEPRLKSSPIEVQIFSDLESVRLQAVAAGFQALRRASRCCRRADERYLRWRQCKAVRRLYTGDKGRAAAMVLGRQAAGSTICAMRGR